MDLKETIYKILRRNGPTMGVRWALGRRGIPYEELVVGLGEA